MRAKSLRVYDDRTQFESVSNLAEAYRIAFPRSNIPGGAEKPDALPSRPGQIAREAEGPAAKFFKRVVFLLLA